MNVLEIITEYLRANGFDGLYNEDAECACEASDLFPCCDIGPTCTAGYKFGCTCGGHDWHIGSAEQRDEWNREHAEDNA